MCPNSNFSKNIDTVTLKITSVRWNGPLDVLDHDGRLNFEEFRRAIKNPPSSDDVEDTAFVIDASEEVMKALDSFDVGPEGWRY